MRNRHWILWVGGALALGLAGCASRLDRTVEPGTSAEVPDATRWVRTQEVVAEAVTHAGPPSTTGTYASCAPPPPSPKCWSGCGLPCQEGISNWHLRGVGGYAFSSGTDAGSECGYAGLDLGYTTACCWGVDLFYRTNGTSFDRTFAVVGAPSFLGQDAGRFHHVGLKATYQRGFGKSPWFGYGGVGVQYFWTSGYQEDDSGWGGFGELGVGYVLSSHWRLRAGVETFVQSTDVIRRNPLDTGEARTLWFAAPVLGVEFAW